MAIDESCTLYGSRRFVIEATNVDEMDSVDCVWIVRVYGNR
jgi:hypothetical protein